MSAYDKFFYERFEFTEEYKRELIELIRLNTNVEIGGYRMWDGLRTHLMQNPWELSDFIIALKKHEQKMGRKLDRFLEVGFASGQNNSILNKFFNFEHIVGLDLFTSNTNGFNLQANMQHKNLTLIVGDSTSERVIDQAGKLGPYDLIFIDANHTYDFVKQDFENFKPFLREGGVIGFHDVDCPDWMGVNKFWKELEGVDQYETQVFVERGYRLQYGIGMLTIK